MWLPLSTNVIMHIITTEIKLQAAHLMKENVRQLQNRVYDLPYPN